MTATTNRQATSALVIYRPLVEKIVAALGALVTHHFAYLIVPLLGLDAHSAVDHGHLSMQWAVLTPLAVAAVVALTVWQLRSLGFRTATSARKLSTWIVAFFLIQETIEGVLAGHSLLELAIHPAIVAGVLLGPVIGWVISRVLIGVTELAAKFFGRPPFGMPPKTRLIPIPVRSNQGRAGSRSRPRAPPS
ncbi:MAG: hypothetical protein ACRBK7_00460 [Acidimicrobiales bacterium]